MMTTTTPSLDGVLTHMRADVNQVREMERAGGHLGHSPLCRHAGDLLAVVDALLTEHKSEPLYARADDAECGHTPPGDDGDDEVWDAWEAGHPEGAGPLGAGIVCKQQVVGYWCTGCADIADGHGCFDVPKAYPPEKCPVRSTITRVLTGKED